MSLSDLIKKHYVVGILGLALASCGDERAETPTPCQSDVECKGDRICVEGYCKDSADDGVMGDDAVDSNGGNGEEGICTKYFSKCSTIPYEEMIQEKGCPPYIVPGGSFYCETENDDATNGDYRPPNLENGLTCEEDYQFENGGADCVQNCTLNQVVSMCNQACGKKEYVDWNFSCTRSQGITFTGTTGCAVIYCAIQTNTCWEEILDHAQFDPNNKPIVDCVKENNWVLNYDNWMDPELNL